jgi:flavin reductase (DIM6/NTAB) family NADH-FMN oxidoreductase RutF
VVRTFRDGVWPASHHPQAHRRLAGAVGRHLLRGLAAAGGQSHLLMAETERPTREFAQAMDELVTGVYLLTARGKDRTPYGIVATSLCAYSADPPAVLACVGRGGPAGTAIGSASTFAVHVLDDAQTYVARAFAAPGEAFASFPTVDWSWDEDVPALAPGQVVAYLRCARLAATRFGDHAIVIGEVERVQTAPRQPLVRARGRLDWRLDNRIRS